MKNCCDHKRSAAPKLAVLTLMKALTYRGIGAVVALGALGSVQAASFTSPPLTHNFTGKSCTTCGTGNDATYQIFSDASGWYHFGNTANPLPSLLNSIDPDFNDHYQVDNITISLHQKFATGAFAETWYWDVGSGQVVDGVAASFQLGSADYQSFILSATENAPAFNMALAGGTGIFQFKFRETTTGNDTFWAFNTIAVVNYSDKPAASVPEAETWSMLLAGLGLVGFMARRRVQAAV